MRPPGQPPFSVVCPSEDELLPTVDVVCRAGERGVGHDVDSERGDVGGADDAADRKRRPQLLASLLESISEQRCRQRRVDEAGGDEVDASRLLMTSGPRAHRLHEPIASCDSR